METTSVSRELLQSYLYAYGEEALAARIPSLDDWQMRDICAAAGRTGILPTELAYVLVAIEQVEGKRRLPERNKAQHEEVCPGH